MNISPLQEQFCKQVVEIFDSSIPDYFQRATLIEPVGNSAHYAVGYMPAKAMPGFEYDPVAIFFTTSGIGNVVLTTFSDGAPEEVASILSEIEIYCRTASQLTMQSVLRIVDSEYALQNGVVGAILGLPECFEHYQNVPKKFKNLNGELIRLIYMVFLGEDEYRNLKKRGLSALDENKDLVTFRQN